MESTLQHLVIKEFITHSRKEYDIPLSYQCFGCPLHTAPVILVNHALTGNSNVAGEKGWWRTLVGSKKPLDTEKYTIICFNIPGNGYDGFIIDDYKDFTPFDIARLFLLGLQKLQVNTLKLLIGGSIGGAIAWEMLTQKPDLAEIFIPIASDFKTTDWLHSQCIVQKFLLESKIEPLQKARIHAMLCYRTPQSLNVRFGREMEEKKGILKSHDWLNYHGKTLNERFSLKAYQLMNHLLMNIDAEENKLKNILSEIHLISVDTDLFFPAFEIKNCYEKLKMNKQNVFYHKIKSIHGHDAFLMEYEQLILMIDNILK